MSLTNLSKKVPHPDRSLLYKNISFIRHGSTLAVSGLVVGFDSSGSPQVAINDFTTITLLPTDYVC